MNKAFLIGNLTRDPELRRTSSDIPVCTFGIAVNRRFANAQGVREVDFFNIVAWRGLAENCSRYLTKGRKCAVVGQIQIRSYDAQDGTKRTVVEIVADDVEFLPSGQSSGSGNYERPPLPDEPPVPGNAFAADGGFAQVDDDELPF